MTARALSFFAPRVAPTQQVSPKRFAVYRKDELVGLTWANSAREAIALYRRFTGLSASSAREEAP